MTTTYNVTVELEAHADQADDLADRLYGSAWAQRTGLAIHSVFEDRNRAALTMTYEDYDLREAVAAALEDVEALGLVPYAATALPTDEFDRRAGGDSEWLSVPQAAGALGISQQRVRQLLDEKKLDGRKVGRDWNVAAQSVRDRLAAQ